MKNTHQNMASLAPGRPKLAGFTLLELVTTMAIVAILMVIGVPSFKYITNSDRSTSQINNLLGDLQFARAEAIRTGQPVSLCFTNDGSTCATAPATNAGWLVFKDVAGTGVYNSTLTPATLLKVQVPIATGQNQLTMDNGVIAVKFNRDGFASALPTATAVTFTLHDATATAAYTRCLSLSIVGAMQTSKSGETTLESTTCN